MDKILVEGNGREFANATMKVVIKKAQEPPMTTSIKAVLVECAWSATRTKNTYLRAKFDSMVGRKRSKKALLIIGHMIFCVIYKILENQVPYQGFDVETFKKARIDKRVAYLQKELNLLGVA